MDSVLRSVAVDFAARIAGLIALSARAGRVALDAVVPPVCVSCREPVSEPHTLCAACWAKLGWIDRPY
ncbi:MAG: double zinc ribbon domain-containing protein, partial [Tagaea sp.]